MVFAQDDEVAFARIIYEFTPINDTTRKDQPYEEDLILYMGKHSSLYTEKSASYHEQCPCGKWGQGQDYQSPRARALEHP